METEELIVKLLKVIGSEEKLNKDIEICQKEIIMSDTIKTYFRKTADEYQNSGNRHNARYFENAMEHCKLLQEIDKFKKSIPDEKVVFSDAKGASYFIIAEVIKADWIYPIEE